MTMGYGFKMKKGISTVNTTRRHVLLGGASLALAARAWRPAFAADDALRALVDGPQRSPNARARDMYRHPYETLVFLGVEPTSTVIEIQPGGGYWTEILAPYLQAKGSYLAALPPDQFASDEAKRENDVFNRKIAATPALYAQVKTVPFRGNQFDLAPAEKADFVLTFRNVHNWMADGETDAAFAAFFKALKPGGILGVEEHRGAPDTPQDPIAKSGYVRQDVAVGFALKAGFVLAASSEINANPKDTKDYPAGVWTLPPAYRLKDQDRDKYAAIGESDRFLLKFQKPKTSV